MRITRWWALPIVGALVVGSALWFRFGADADRESEPTTMGVPFPLVAFAVQSIESVREVSPATDPALLSGKLILRGFSFADPTALQQTEIVGTVALLECDLIARSLKVGEELSVTFRAEWHAGIRGSFGREFTGLTAGRLTLVAEHGAARADVVAAFAHSELARLLINSLASELRADVSGR